MNAVRCSDFCSDILRFLSARLATDLTANANVLRNGGV